MFLFFNLILFFSKRESGWLNLKWSLFICILSYTHLYIHSFIYFRFVVPESPRWLLVKGRVDEVKRIIQSAADFNKRELPPNFEAMLKPPTKEDSSQDFLCLFRIPYLRRITICFLCIWFTMNLAYYGFILNMSTFGGNVYLNSVS